MSPTGKQHGNKGALATMTTYATPRNMRAVEDNQYPNARRHVFAYSPTSGEEYSATPGDYWDRPDDEPLRDANGGPMVLAVRQTRYVDALTGEDVQARLTDHEHCAEAGKCWQDRDACPEIDA